MPSYPDRSVLLAGASIRSLAATAIRSGIQPHCVDLFCDSDLLDACRAANLSLPVPIADFSDLLHAVRNVPDSIPFVWAGGLENWPEVLDDLSGRFRVCGSPSSVVRSLTDPTQLQSIVASTDASTPPILEGNEDIGLRAGSWLVKPHKGSGGSGIRPWGNGEVVDAGHYMQEQVDGVPISALYISSASGTRLLTASVQLTGEKLLGGSGMQFCGNIGPLRLPLWLAYIFTDVGQQVGQLGMIGVFGADFVVSPNKVWLIEVNPRITASHENYDLLASGPSLLEQHIDASLPDDDWDCHESSEGYRSRSRQLLARLIVYSKNELCMDAAAVAQLKHYSRSRQPSDDLRNPVTAASNSAWIADIPSGGDIQHGQPFCSIYCMRSCTEIGQTSRTKRQTEIEQLVGSFTGLPATGIFTAMERWDSLFEAAFAGDNVIWSVPDACRL